MIGRRRSIRVRYTHRPLAWLFPKMTIAVSLLTVLARTFAAVVVGLWPYRRELFAAAVFVTVWREVGRTVPGWWSLLVTTALTITALSVRGVSPSVRGWLAAGRTRRRLLHGLVQ